MKITTVNHALELLVCAAEMATPKNPLEPRLIEIKSICKPMLKLHIQLKVKRCAVGNS